MFYCVFYCRSPVATVLVQQGVISVGSLLVASSTWARVRQMSDDVGKDVERAFPSMPIRISGWRALPTAGDLVFAMKTEVFMIDYYLMGCCVFVVDSMSLLVLVCLFVCLQCGLGLFAGLCLLVCLLVCLIISTFSGF